MQVKIKPNFCQRFFKNVKKNLPIGFFHNLKTFQMCKPPPKVIFRREQREGNRNIRRNASTLVISPLLTLLSAHAESAVVLKVLSLTKVEDQISRCYFFPYYSVWFMGRFLCLYNVWKGRSYVNVNVFFVSLFNNQEW